MTGFVYFFYITIYGISAWKKAREKIVHSLCACTHKARSISGDISSQVISYSGKMDEKTTEIQMVLKKDSALDFFSDVEDELIEENKNNNKCKLDKTASCVGK